MNLKNGKYTYLLFAILFLGKISFSQVRDNIMNVDHRYSPAWWQTLVCMPDDPVKTLVGKEGQVFGDYGYKGPRDFSFSIQFDSKVPAHWIDQKLESAQVPMPLTIKESDGIHIEEQTFLQIPPAKQLAAIVRFDSRRIIRGWAKPTIPCDKAFQDIAEGKLALSGEGLVEFHIKVSPGSSHKIALGFCEGEMKTSGQRVMDIHIEGAPLKEIDPAKDFGPNQPGIYFFSAKDVNKDGILNVVVRNAPGAKNRNAFVNGIWMFKDNTPSPEAIISGKENKNCELYAACADVPMPQRCYHILITLKNTNNSDKSFDPVILYSGIEPIKDEGKFLKIGDETILSSSDNINNIISDSTGSFKIHLSPIKLKHGEQKKIVITINRFYNSNNYIKANIANTEKEKTLTTVWWQKNCPSVNAVQVPDAGIQGMAESCIRNIFQARDIRDGKPSFNVGPTIYRGLWIADGSFILETATMLNYIKDVRNCIDYLTSFQLKDGGFDMIPTFYKENGLVPFMLIRHAMLTQDKKWLNENWNVIEGCIRRINYLRAVAMKDSTKPYYGLLPDGNVDGGIQHGDDYSNTEWCLSGMKWAIKACKWLGRNEQAKYWQLDYDTLFGNWMKKARHDIRKDDKGNLYLPVMINNEGNYEAQRGQWAFCQSVYPGQIFDDNPEVHKWAEETVDMLTDHRVEGLVVSTGWMTDGLWTYFSSFYGHALLWLGKTHGIPQLLYDYANHSSPTMVWREEQKPVGKGDDEVGDMPHNWASAEFIRMVVHMIEIDRGNELDLFEALPKQWVRSGNLTKLTGIRTPFGRINLALKVNSKGDSAMLNLEFLDKGNLPSKIVIHKKTWNSGEALTVNPSQRIAMVIPIK